MVNSGTSKDEAVPEPREVVAWIDAVLGTEGKTRAQFARQILDEARRAPADHKLKAWLEAVAIELQEGSAPPASGQRAKAIAAHIRANPRQSSRAHARIDRRTMRNLVRRP